MTDHNPYTYELIDRTSTADDHYVSAEDWRDARGHRTHIAVAIGDYEGNDEVTIVISSADEARRLKNLFSKIERRMQ